MMFLDDLMHDRQAEAGAFVFSALVLGGEEWIEDVFKISFLDAVAGVFRFDLSPLFPPAVTSFLVRTRSVPPRSRIASIAFRNRLRKTCLIC